MAMVLCRCEHGEAVSYFRTVRGKERLLRKRHDDLTVTLFVDHCKLPSLSREFFSPPLRPLSPLLQAPFSITVYLRVPFPATSSSFPVTASSLPRHCEFFPCHCKFFSLSLRAPFPVIVYCERSEAVSYFHRVGKETASETTRRPRRDTKRGHCERSEAVSYSHRVKEEEIASQT